MGSVLGIGDLTRPLAQLAADLPEWRRGDRGEAAAATLDLAERNSHARAYTAWIWLAQCPDGAAAWILPVRVEAAERWAPRGPVRLIARTFTAAVEAGSSPAGIAPFDWEGFVALRVPEADPQLAPIALRDAHPQPASVDTASLLDARVDGPPLDLAPPSEPVDDGPSRAAARIHTHPLRIAGALVQQGWHLDEADYPPEAIDVLRHGGHAGTPPEPGRPSLAIDDDPCPRRRVARRLLRRLLHKRKIGAGYHTAIDHVAHGVAPEDRADAYGIGEALLRAGLLGEKPSVGQRHVFLRREALPDIHALIERGETHDPALAAFWSAPPPGRRRT